MKIECKRCKNSWNYRGSRYWAQCPRCMYSMKIREASKITTPNREIYTIPEEIKKQEISEELTDIKDANKNTDVKIKCGCGAELFDVGYIDENDRQIIYCKSCLNTINS